MFRTRLMCHTLGNGIGEGPAAERYIAGTEPEGHRTLRHQLTAWVEVRVIDRSTALRDERGAPRMACRSVGQPHRCPHCVPFVMRESTRRLVGGPH